jgi:putative endonuclease
MEWLGQLRLSCVDNALRGLEWAARRSGRREEMAEHLETGLSGEDAAYFYLRRKGYRVVARRWSSGRVRGDLDLVAWQGEILCVIEVKTRTAHDLMPAEFAVDEKKREVLRRLARLYLRQLTPTTPPTVRFDVLSVYLVPGTEEEIVHIERAFGWSEREPRDHWE